MDSEGEGRRIIKIQGHLLSHRKFKASVAYERLCPKKVRNLNDGLLDTVDPWLTFILIYATTGLLEMTLSYNVNILNNNNSQSLGSR